MTSPYPHITDPALAGPTIRSMIRRDVERRARTIARTQEAILQGLVANRVACLTNPAIGRLRARMDHPDAVLCMTCHDPIQREVLAPHDPGRWLHLCHHSWAGWHGPHDADPGPHDVGYQAPALLGEVSREWARTAGGMVAVLPFGPPGFRTGYMQVAYDDGWEWRCCPASEDRPGPWTGSAPTPTQAMLDAQVHAQVCPLCQGVDTPAASVPKMPA